MVSFALTILLGCSLENDQREHSTQDPGQLPTDWELAWPVLEGTIVSAPTGHLYTEKGLIPYQASTCGSWYFTETKGGIFTTASASNPKLPPTPAVQAAVVERAAWKLGEILGDDDSLALGGRAEKDPATHKGIRVRSVKKTRRQGPPVLAVTGQRRGSIIAAITNRNATETLSSVVFDVDGPPWTNATTMPIADYNQDGQLDWLIYGQHGQGQMYRALIQVDLTRDIDLDLKWVALAPDLKSCQSTIKNR